MNPLWKVYKTKVMKTLNPEYEEDPAEEVDEMANDMSPVQEELGPAAVSQLARRMQGAGTKGWSRLSALFSKDDEHQLLEETESPPAADHPLAAKPAEPPRPTKRAGFWDNFAASWAAKKQAGAAAAATTAQEAAPGQGEEVEEEGVMEAGGEERHDGQITEGEEKEGAGSSKNSFSKYVSLGRDGEDASFRWNFISSKLAELKTKTN